MLKQKHESELGDTEGLKKIKIASLRDYCNRKTILLLLSTCNMISIDEHEQIFIKTAKQDKEHLSEDSNDYLTRKNSTFKLKAINDNFKQQGKMKALYLMLVLSCC